MTLESGGGGGINSDREGSTPLNLPILRALVRIAAIMFFGILVYHCYSQVKNTKAWKKLSTWVSVRARFEHNCAIPVMNLKMRNRMREINYCLKHYHV